jgi:hypothetical protein
MLRGVSVKSTIGFFAALVLACSAVVFAQQAPQGQAQGQGRGGRGGGAANAAGGAGGGGARGGGARAAVADPVLVVKVEWVRPEGQTGQVPIVQGNVADPNLELKKYGKAAAQLLTSNQANPFGTWSGECEGPFAVTFRHKSNYLDLRGASRIHFVARTSGFHAVQPVIKLADGTLLVGDYQAVSIPIMAEFDFGLSGMRWIKLDPDRVVTLNAGAKSGGGTNEIWYQDPDLSKVDEIGFATLMPSSGHGNGGFINVAQFEVYGQPVPR